MTSNARHPVLLFGTVAGALALCAILIVAFVQMRSTSGTEYCSLNLRYLDMAIKGAALPGDSAWEKASPGRAFFLDRHLWPAPPERPIEPHLRCPIRGVNDGEIDYRGPAKALHTLSNDDPICADRPGNHGPDQGGNVLLKDGRIIAADPADGLWARAAETTSD